MLCSFIESSVSGRVEFGSGLLCLLGEASPPSWPALCFGGIVEECSEALELSSLSVESDESESVEVESESLQLDRSRGLDSATLTGLGACSRETWPHRLFSLLNLSRNNCSAERESLVSGVILSTAVSISADDRWL